VHLVSAAMIILSSRHPRSRHEHPDDAKDHQKNAYNKSSETKFAVIAKNNVVQHHHSSDYSYDAKHNGTIVSCWICHNYYFLSLNEIAFPVKLLSFIVLF